MKVVELPLHNVTDIPSCLRNLADAIEKGEYGKPTHFAWVLDTEFKEVAVGLAGLCANPDAVAVLLFEAAKANLIRRMGK